MHGWRRLTADRRQGVSRWRLGRYQWGDTWHNGWGGVVRQVGEGADQKLGASQPPFVEFQEK